VLHRGLILPLCVQALFALVLTVISNSPKLLTNWSLAPLNSISYSISGLAKMSFKPIYAITSLAISAIFLVGCSKHEEAQEPIRAVKVLTVGADSMHTGYEFAGEVRARAESRLGFRVSGKIIRRQVELGQRVKAGEVLAQLDPQDYKLATDAARAQLGAAATNRDLAAADYKRYKELKDQNFISGADLERRETTLKAAVAQYDQAQAQLSSQGNQAAYTALVSDVSGVVTSVDAEVGQVVSAGTPVIRIAQDGPRDAVFSVAEDKIGMVMVGSGAEVTAWNSKEKLSGHVREVAASADPVTRTFAVKVALDAKDALPLGTTVSVVPQAFDRSGVQVIKVPTSALRRDADKSAVWVLDVSSMTVNLQPVVIATADGNDAVVSSGLKPGMHVVSAGVHVLSPGQKVTIYQDKYANAAGK
jgi:RND family efflux transporter MFP subunit